MQTKQSVAQLRVRVGCAFEYEASQIRPAVFLVRPESTLSQRVIDERWDVTPAVAHHDYRDLYGNACRRLSMPPGPFAARYDAIVDVPNGPDPADFGAVQHPVENLPDETLLYTLPSRYCLSDELFDRAWQLFGDTRPGWSCVQTICDWVHSQITFQYGASNPATTALDVLAQGMGVCRDYAHLAITFCRAMNIPARYAFGYIPDIDVPPPYTPMDFCAWFEAYLGDRWWAFDPRNNTPRRGRITIARGRDALDVAMVTVYGPSTLAGMTVWADQVGNDERLAR
jgi:transglutaminase-like putative cysteine protease